METLRDNLWIWGHDAGCHHRGAGLQWKIPGTNNMGPWEGAEYLGIPNCCRVIFEGNPQPPFDAESEKLRSFNKVGWSVMGDTSSSRNNGGADDLDEVLKQAERFPFVTGGVLDDFFRPDNKDARMTLERLKEVHHALNNAPRPLELWLVYYAALFGIDYDAYLKEVDVVTFWSWDSKQLAQAEQNLEKIIAMTPGKKHYAGCYLYNYGDCCPITDEEMKFQLDLYLRLWLEKKIDGIIVCSNNIVDTGLNSVEIFRAWQQENGSRTR